MGITGPIVLHQRFTPVSGTCSPWKPRPGEWWAIPGGLGDQCFRSPLLLLPWQLPLFRERLSLFLGAFALPIPTSGMLECLSAHQTPNHPSKPMGTKALSTQFSRSENTPCKDCPECPFVTSA